MTTHEHTAENGLPPLAVETHCIGCGHPNPTGLHIAGCAEAQRKLREPVQFAPAVENDADEAEVYVVTTPKGFTQIFDATQIRALVLLGLIEHERDGWLLENGKGEHLGPVHHFYREARVIPPGSSGGGE